MNKFVLLLAIALFLGGCQKPGVLKDDAAMTAVPGKAEPMTDAVELAGVINKDTTLSGTVNIVKDVYVQKGVTLTIEPGTTLVFEKSESTKIEPLYLSSGTEILVAGRIIAKGTSEKRISFIPKKKGADKKDYAGIILLKSAESHFENCLFQGAEYAITAIDTNVSITDTTFEECFYALSAKGSTVEFTGSSVKDCDKGLYFFRGSKGTVVKSTFTGTNEEALFISNLCTVSVSESLFENNNWGVTTILDEKSITNNNEFKNNKIDVRKLLY